MNYQINEVEEDESNLVIETGEVLGMYIDLNGQVSNIKPTERMRFGEDLEVRADLQYKVEGLREMYKGYIGHIAPENIMILENVSWTLSEKNSENTKADKITIRKASPMERILTGYDYVLGLKRFYLKQWTEAQLHAAIMSQLLKINSRDASITKYNEDHYSKMVTTLGAGYLDKGVAIEDILLNKVEFVGFKRADEQVTIEEVESGRIQEEIKQLKVPDAMQLKAPEIIQEEIIDVEIETKTVRSKSAKPVPMREAQ